MFFKNLVATKKFQVQETDMEQVPCWAPTNIRCRHRKFSCTGNLVPGVCAPCSS